MPVYNRKTLRQLLGQDRLRDTLVSTTTGSCAMLASGGFFIDSNQADAADIGESLYDRAVIRYSKWGEDYRVATFNAGSGAFLTLQPLTASVALGDEYEVHQMLPAEEKHRAIDRVIRMVWERKEQPLQGIQAKLHYSIGPELGEVFGAYYYGDPSHSLDRQRHNLAWWAVVETATGRELRIAPALLSTDQIALDAQVFATLGSGDVGTVNLPDLEWFLDGAAAAAYEALGRRAPGQEAAEFRREAARYATRFQVGAGRWLPPVTRKVQLDNPY